ncbi:phenylacetate--CoA ligase family protein [Nocardia australiensis]|uniref:phenylacetate--CoA ligase family protein n=1 Tax=Nocardia australiensis TaxID=2887191 RepID=UPI001D13F0E5|nr:AMP-binding protein [Nocardia australiensis]
MDAGREYWDMEIEPLLNTPEIKDVQWGKLQQLLTRLYDSKPFWRERMDTADARPQDLKSLEDFSRRMPIMDKAQRRQLVLDCDGDVIRAVDQSIAVPVDDVVLMAATSGTTGEPTPYPHTERDNEINAEVFARILWRAGLRRGDRVVHAFGLSMWLAGVPYVQRMQNSGVCMLPVGAEGGSERILRFAKQFQATALFATPSLVEHLIEKAPDLIGMPVSDLGIKTILCAGEPGAGIAEVRNRIESSYGATLYDHGGGYGISCGHAEYQGMHHVADDKMIFELVDPDTREPIPFEHGAKGLAVQTSLEAEGMLWMRETFGDIVQVFTEPCPCGMSGFRFKVVGRADDMLKVKGVMVYPAAIDGVITGFAPQVTGEFRIVLDNPPPRVVPPLVLRVEYDEHVSPEQLPALAGEIESHMRSTLKISPRIEWVAPYSFERTGGKTNFFERRY